MTGGSHLADALAVDQWAERTAARSDFPRLIRRLIKQTNDQVAVLDMPAGEATDFAGYDGIVETRKKTPFVPEGSSVWELGVGEDPKKKANKDYKTRTDNPLGVDQSTTTFVFVTARRWSGKDEWAREKRAEKKWADVWALDADNIETAFEAAPPVHFWFSERIGLPVDGVRMIESWWDAFSQTSQPNLTPEMVLTGRADKAADLLRLLEEETRLTTLSAASPDDALAFVASTVLSTSEPTRSDLLARTLIVHSTSALRRLDATTNLLILLPFDDELRREAKLVRSHHVVLLAPENVPSDIELHSIDRNGFAALLVEIGTNEEVATKLALAAHRSLIAFQAETSSQGGPRRDWSSSFEAKVVRRAWLAGGWQEARSGDTDALALLFGVAYDDARAELAPLARGEDPIFATVGGTWGLVSAEEAWRFGHAHLAGPDLVALETVMQTVLGAVDPALELPVEERWKAGVYGKSRIHSSDLRKGLAATLAVCGALGSETRVGAVGSVADWAASVIAQLLRRANEDRSGDVWASLADVLPLLAEAAPDVFLREVQDGARARSEPLLTRMFLDSQGDAFSVSSPHTGLLWALENLAWSPEHAGLAVQLLARLAEIDPGGKLSNRPLASLVNIFRPWLPQTSLSLVSRISVLDALRRDHPTVAWTLMLDLLPEHFGVGHYTHAPAFRKWKSEEASVTNGERWEFESAVARRLLEDAEVEPERWLPLVERFDRVPPPDRPAAIEHLDGLADREDLDPAFRTQLWDQLDQLVRRHQSFASAEWALPRDELDRLAEVAAKLRPGDPILSSSWLFDSQLPDLGDERLEYHEQEERASEARSKAVEDILEAHGFDGLLHLASEVEFPWLVGNAAASHTSTELDAKLVTLLDNEDSRRVNFASGYTYMRARDGGVEWLESMIPTLAGKPLAQARLLQASDDLPAVWRIATELGTEVEQAYWDEFSPMGRGDFQLVNESARSLLDFDRPVTALDLLALYANRTDRRVSADLALEALEAFVRLPADHREQTRVSTYDLQTLLDYIREGGADDERLAALEWQLLPGLGFAARSPTLERRLARDPVFFIEVLSLIYRPRGSDEPSKTPEHLATNAFRLLGEWRIVPGSSTETGEVDGDALEAWVSQARTLARDVDRGEVGDLEIGKILANTRGDDDGTWPTRPVRDLIERVASPELEQGFGIEIYNNRGGTSRAVFAGGDQERTLATKYDDLASKIRDGWPRTAAVLSSLARGYEREAQRWDEDAERLRQGLER